MNVVKLNGRIRRADRGVTDAHRSGVKDRINSAERVFDYHLVLAHIHDLRQCERDDRSYNNVENKIQQELICDPAAREPQRARDQKRENAVYRRRVEHHRHTELLCVRDDPLLILVNRPLELSERENRLSEGLDDRNAAHVLDRLVRHRRERVSVLTHLLRHALAGHRGQHREAEKNREQD